jgi:organic radical activating enzyme
VPFCRHACPYCPYTKIRYDEVLVEGFTRAAIAEVEWWAKAAGPCDITSVYIGGGTPTLALDGVAAVIDRVRSRFRLTGEIAIESNGTIAAPAGLDWICISPKADAPVVQSTGQELKLVYPQAAAMPERFEHLDFERFWLQPMDGPNQAANTAAAIEYCLTHPRWRLSVQTHKYIGVR